MQRFSNLVIRFRIFVILITLILSFWFVLLLPSLEVDSDILNYFPDSDEAVQLFDEVGLQFAGNSLAIIAVESDNVFTEATLRTIHRITEKARAIPEITSVTSLTDILDISSGEWGLEVGKLIDKYRLPTDTDELARLRSYTLGKDLYSGRIVSEDGTVALVIARIREGENRTVVGSELKVAAQELNVPEALYYAGAPFQMLDIQKMIVRDVRYLVPLVSILLVLVLALSFRSFVGVVFPLLTVLLSTVWGLGCMVLADVPLTVISNITPVVLLAVGSAYGIHFVSRLSEKVGSSKSRTLQVRSSLASVGLPIILAGVTTLTGFLSFTGSYLTIIKYFGLFTALGVCFAMLLAITFLPALASFTRGGSSGRSSERSSGDFVTRTMDRLGAFVLRREWWILGIAALVIILSTLGLPHLTREVDMLGYFPGDSDIHIAEHLMEEKFGGSIPIQVSVRGDLHDPLVLKKIWALHKYLEMLPSVNKPQSISNLIAEMNFVMNGRYTIPDTREKVDNLWFFLEGEETLEQLVDSEHSWGLIQASMASVNTETIRRTVDALDTYVSEHIDISTLRVNLDSISLSQASYALARQRERITTLICDDAVSRKNGEGLESTHVYELLSRYQAAMPLALSVIERTRLETLITDYYTQGLAQVSLEPVHDVARAISELGVGSVPTMGKITGVLRTNLVEDNDPEGLIYDAEALQTLIREARGDFLANSLLEEISIVLPADLQADSIFLKRLRGDLWELNHRHVLIQAPETEGGTPGALTAQQTGLPLIYKHLDDNLVKTQIFSLLITIILVIVMIALQFRSLVAGFLGIIPLGFTVLINFGVMAYLGVAIDTATVLVGSIAIGIGIDYTIHFLWRLRAEAMRHSSPLDILDATLETTGRAILINAVTVGLGFLVLILASVIPLRHFGWLTSLTMATSAFAAICVLPAMILAVKPRFIFTLINNNHARIPQNADGANQKEI
jgi:predicted RND superfamily exporter protein